MKHIKQYESIEEVNINVGDTVICVDNTGYKESLTLNKIYIVELYDSYWIYVTNDRNVKGSNFRKYRFRTLTPKEIDNYNMKQSANKYNL